MTTTHIHRHTRDGLPVVVITGTVTRNSGTRLIHAILRAINSSNGPSVIVDLSQIDSFDPAGVGPLHVGDRAARLVGGRLLLVLSTEGGPAVVDVEAADKLLQATPGSSGRRKSYPAPSRTKEES